MTLQEKLEISGNVAFVGVTVVFLILGLLILIVSLSAFLLRLTQKKNGTPPGPNAADPADSPEADDSPQSSPTVLSADMDAQEDSEQGESMDPATIAAIMAAITVMLDGVVNFRLRSIRRTGSASPAWNLSGRKEYLSTRL